MLTLRKSWVRFLLAMSLTLLLAAGLARSAEAVDVRGGDTITIGKDEVVDDDLFLAGNIVVMNGTVSGNLFVAGSQIEVNGTVNGSLFLAGQSLTVNGKVSGSVFGGSASMRLGPQASVGRNVFYGGFGLTSEPGSTVGRDLLMGGYQAVLGGDIARDLRFGGGALELSGKVGRDVIADVSAPGTDRQAGFTSFTPGMPAPIAPGLRVSNRARIGGTLTYSSPVEQASAIQSAPAGGVAYKARQERGGAQAQRNVVGEWIADLLREFMTLLVLGLLAVWQLPALLNHAADKVRARPLPSAGWGLIVLIGGFILAFLAALAIIIAAILLGIITLGGLGWTTAGVGFSALALVFSLFMLLISYGSKLVIAYLVGRLVLLQVAKQYADHKVWPLLLGIVLYVLVASIPLLGGIVGIIATLVGLGALWLLYRERRPASATAIVAG